MPIRVLIVDDSLMICQILEAMLADVPDIHVVGNAKNGQEALRMTMRLHPDVITLDIRMPVMDGLEATRQIMRIQPTPIVVLSSSVYASDYNIAFSAIEAGALAVIEKPRGLGIRDFETVKEQLITALRTMSGVTVIGRSARQVSNQGIGPMTAMLYSYFSHTIRVVGIAASTGGPPVLVELLSSLPPDFSIPIVIVQHILPPFIQPLVDWLNSRSHLPVNVAFEGARLAPGQVFVAPGDEHLVIQPGGTLHIHDGLPVNGQRPSATVLFDSIAQVFGANAVGMILSGMGDDGVDGLERMSKAGAHIIAQDQASSVIYGMPKEAVDRGIVDEALSPDQLATRLVKLHRHMQSLKKY